jgi:hypothetical protein
MALADAYRRAAQAGRAAAQAAGQRPVTVTIRLQTYDDGVNVAGGALTATTDTTITPNPKVTPVAEGPGSAFGGGEAQGTSGVLRATTYRVGPITPTHPGGGYSKADLAPDGGSDRRVSVILAGGAFAAGGERYQLVALDDTTSPQSTFLLVTRRDQ